MNKAAYLALMEDGAFFNARENRLYHPSFKKGWRNASNLKSFWCALNELSRLGVRLDSNKEPHIWKVQRRGD